jgi:hypothetical protein
MTKSVTRYTSALGGEEAGPQVTVGVHLLAELEEALLGADGAGAPFRTADGAEEDGIGSLGGGEGLVCEGAAGGIDGALLGKSRQVSKR